MADLETLPKGADGRRLKVAHVTTIAASLQYLLLNLLESLVEEGYEVVGVSAPGPEVEELAARGVSHRVITISRRMAPFEDLRALWQLVRLFRREGFDVVHTHTPKPGLLGQLAARLAGVPVIVNTIHGFYFHEHSKPMARRALILLEKIAARCSTRILSQNFEDVGTAIKEGITQPERIEFLGSGIDVKRFQPDRIDSAAVAALRREFDLPVGIPVVGFVGRLVAEKGILELLEAAGQVLDEFGDFRLLLVGPRDDIKADALTEEVAARFGVEKICRFTGMREDMVALYASMDLFVLPSHREGLPRAPMEAASMGLARIVTNVRGCRETVTDGHDGLLVPVRDPGSLAQAIVRLLRDPEEARRLAEQALETSKERFDEELAFEQIKNVYGQELAKLGR
ncbi:MAG: glycosyltransferase family 4 protein [Deltaproteobacteria bacterium]|nr:glycosyltransferase family 4 protein [Deltaproteobacteria bacterium]